MGWMHSGDEGITTNKRSSHLLTNCENSRSARHSRSSKDEMRPSKRQSQCTGCFGGQYSQIKCLEPTKRRALIRLSDSSAGATAECHKLDWKNNVCGGCVRLRRPPFPKLSDLQPLRVSIHYSIHINLFILLAAAIT